MGKMGAFELNYSSDIDLIALYEADGQTDGSRGKTGNAWSARHGALGEVGAAAGPVQVWLHDRHDL